LLVFGTRRLKGAEPISRGAWTGIAVGFVAELTFEVGDGD